MTTVVDGTANTADVSLNFLGNATSLAQAMATLSAFAAGDTQDFGAVFDQSASTLYIDSNHDGALSGADMQIQVSGLTAAGIVAGDLKIA